MSNRRGFAMNDNFGQMPSTSGPSRRGQEAEEINAMPWSNILTLFNNAHEDEAMDVLEHNYNSLLTQCENMKAKCRHLRDQCAAVSNEKKALRSQLDEVRNIIDMKNQIVIDSTSSEDDGMEQEQERARVQNGMRVITQKRKSHFEVEYQDPRRKIIRFVSNTTEQQQTSGPGYNEELMPNDMMVSMRSLQYTQRTMQANNEITEIEDSD